MKPERIQLHGHWGKSQSFGRLAYLVEEAGKHIDDGAPFLTKTFASWDNTDRLVVERLHDDVCVTIYPTSEENADVLADLLRKRLGLDG